MKKYEVIQYYGMSKVYVVEADDEQDALDKVHDGKVRPEYVLGREFIDELIGEFKNEKGE